MFDGREPIYRQIADQIRQDVVEGALQEEEQVMSTTQYATIAPALLHIFSNGTSTPDSSGSFLRAERSDDQCI